MLLSANITKSIYVLLPYTSKLRHHALMFGRVTKVNAVNSKFPRFSILKPFSLFILLVLSFSPLQAQRRYRAAEPPAPRAH